MGQLWEFVNPDRREKMMGGFKLGELFFCNIDDGFWELLFLKLRLPCLPSELEVWLSDSRDILQTSRLANLPTDILNIIFDEIVGNLHDLASFAITCKATLAASKPYLLESLKSTFASWAGGRMMYLGEYTTYDEDLPAGFLTQDELDEVKPAFSSEDEFEEDYDDHRRYGLFATSTYKDVSNKPRWYDYENCRWYTMARTASFNPESSTAASKQDFHMFNILCNYPRSEEAKAYPEGESVLYNLSKGEYVRSRSMWDLEAPNKGGLTILNALFARICWSGDEPDNNALELDEAQHQELVRGKWAGDRFCITTLEDMPLAPDGREWVDVSEETTEFVYHLWRHAERGDTLCDTLAKA